MNMKRSVFWLLMGVPMLTFAQQNYNIQVKVGHLVNPGKAYLYYQMGNELATDSASLNSGIYHFKGSVAEPALARVCIFENKVAPGNKLLFNAELWLEKASIKVTAADPLATPIVTGGKLNGDYQALHASKAPERKQMLAASKRVSDGTEEEKKSPEFLKQHMLVMKAAMNKSAERDSLYIRNHPDSYLSLYLISLSTSSVPYLSLEKDLKALSKPLQSSARGKDLLYTINTLKNREIGGKAPDFTLDDPSGKAFSLSSFRGKYVLLDFWASWCVPCRKENPNVKAAYEQFKDKNFTVLSVSIDAPATKAKWLEAIKEDQLNWTQLCDAQGGSQQAALLYNVMAIPQNYLIDPSGKIIAKNLRGAELQQKLGQVVHQ